MMLEPRKCNVFSLYNKFWKPVEFPWQFFHLYLFIFPITSKCAKHFCPFFSTYYFAIFFVCLFFVSFCVFPFFPMCFTGQVEMGAGRKISVVSVPSANRWQDVVLGRMKWATITIDEKVRNEPHNAKTLTFSSGYISSHIKSWSTYETRKEKHDLPALSSVPPKNKYGGL